MSYSIKSYMEKNVNTISGEVTVAEAAKKMTEKKDDYPNYSKRGKASGHRY